MFRTPSLVAAALACLVGLGVSFVREVDRAGGIGRGPERGGTRIERCMTCHAGPAEDPGGAHASAALGCASCHLGNPLAYQRARAHEGLVREAGGMATVAWTCGSNGCHPREAARVSSSPMLRNSGIVAVDRFVFGEIAAPSSPQTIQEVLAAARPTGAEVHLRRLCGGCHLGTVRANRDDAIVGNGSGCSSCHAPPRRSGDRPRAHPPIDARVSDDRCFGCHSRSGRIGLSYQGLAEMEERQVEKGVSPCAAPTRLPDGRPACRFEPDVHHAAGMSCVDCHLHTEVMGDGTVRAHEEEQVELTCETCHGPDPRKTSWAGVDDAITRDLLRLRNQSRPPRERVRLARRGTPLWNLRPSATGWDLFTKLGGRALPVKATPADANHGMKGHARLSCSSCHAASAPTCSSCHTRFEKRQSQWDFSAGREVPGAWIEESEGFGFAPPALGVQADGMIVPAIPGMILDIDLGRGDGRVSKHRLFAPLEPHTTGKKARTCESCHRSAGALGLGTGTLELDRDAPIFDARAAEPRDPALARDGWTTLFAETPGRGTRVGFRSLDAQEQRRVLTVGACLPCHAKEADPIWRDFRASIARFKQGSRCTFGSTAPAWVVR